MAAICNNNCGRQVFGTALARGPVPTHQADRSSACSAFLTTVTTVTPGQAPHSPALVALDTPPEF